MAYFSSVRIESNLDLTGEFGRRASGQSSARAIHIAFLPPCFDDPFFFRQRHASFCVQEFCAEDLLNDEFAAVAIRSTSREAPLIG